MTGTVIAFNGYFSVVNVDGAGQSELSVMKERIFVVDDTPVFKVYGDFFNSFLRLSLIPNCSAMRDTTILAIMTESVQVLTRKI